MNYQLVYLCLLFVLGIIAVLSLFYIRIGKTQYRFQVKKRSLKYFENHINNNIYKNEIEELLLQSGFNITNKQYQFLRYTCFITLIIINIVFKIIFNNLDIVNNLIIIYVLFLFTSPKTYFFGKKTPLKYTLDFFVAIYKSKLNAEIIVSISQIKNMSISRYENKISSDYILEQIAKFSKKTKPIFNKMIALWNLNKKDEACKYFELAIGTKEAQGLTDIFRKMDSIMPSELYNQILLLQETVNKERETRKLIANENKSNIIYFIVVITSFIIMINFVVVVYYLEFLNQMRFIQ